MTDCCPSKNCPMSDYYYQNDKTSFKMKKKVQPFIRYHVIFLFVSHITYAFMCIMYDYHWNVDFISINQHKHCSVFCEYSATERISFNTRIIRIIRIWWAKKTVSIEFFFLSTYTNVCETIESWHFLFFIFEKFNFKFDSSRKKKWEQTNK